MKSSAYTISLVFYPFSGNNIKEITSVKNALESFGNKVSTVKANRDLISILKTNAPDIVFNLAHKNAKYNHTTAVSAISELLELNVIGPNVFASSVCNSKKDLFQILKFDGIPIVDRSRASKSSNLIQVFLLGNYSNPLFFFKTPIHLKIDYSTEQKITDLCKKAQRSIHGSDYCQFTFQLDNNTNPILIELNPYPLLGKDNTFARLVKIKGINYTNFINIILLNAFTRYNLPITQSYQDLKDLMEKKTSNPQKIAKT